MPSIQFLKAPPTTTGGSVSDNERRQRVLSEGQAIVADSTSDDTNSSDAASGPAPNTAINSISEEDQQDLDEKCRPITSMMVSLPKETTHKFVFDACAGLSGTETL